MREQGIDVMLPAVARLDVSRFLPKSAAEEIVSEDVQKLNVGDYSSFVATIGPYFTFFHLDMTAAASYMHILEVSQGEYW